MATSWYSTKRVLDFCMTVPEKIDNKRKERLNKRIKDLIERTREAKKKWYYFYLHVPTEEEALRYLKIDCCYLSTYEQIMTWWLSEDKETIAKILALCKTTDGELVNLNSEEVSMLRYYGMEDGEGHKK